jgi:3-hydroxymyristoyl/3-hydroxydecanoyl-(acyl carrier protein) dehydratase
MSRLRLIVFALLLLVAVPCRSFAHGDIVYSARYYLPPGSNGHSHYHIYRIDPNGSHRVQPTFGNSEDEYPQWGGRNDHIQFYRTVHPSGDCYSMEMQADGSHLSRIKAVNRDAQFGGESPASVRYENNGSPNRRYYCDPSEVGNSLNIVDSTTEKTISKLPSGGGALWLSNSKLVALDIVDGVKFTYTTYNINGRQLSSIALKNISSNDELEETEEDWATPFWCFTFRPNPVRPGTYFVESEARRATELYCLDPERKTIQFLTNADTESWSPDYKSFCTCADWNDGHRIGLW